MFAQGLYALAQLPDEPLQCGARGEIPCPVSVQHICIREEVVVLVRVAVALFLYGANILARRRVLDRHAVLCASAVDIVQQLVDVLEPDVAIDEVEVLA